MIPGKCLECPTVIYSKEKKRPRLRCADCQKERQAVCKYNSLKNRRARFGRYYTPMKPTERRV